MTIHIADRDLQNRADRLACNPLNIPGIPGSPPMTLFGYWAARFEREGWEAPADAACPYNPGTMAATRWQAGRDARAALEKGRP